MIALLISDAGYEEGEGGLVDYEEELDNAINEIRALLLKKHHDYGSRNLVRFGMLGVLVRLSDKMERLIHIQQAAQVEDETKIDTLRDVAGYAIQAILMERRVIQ